MGRIFKKGGVKMYRWVLVVVIMFLIGACESKGCNPAGPKSGNVVSGNGNISQIYVDGVPVLVGTGIYIIGDCDGSDGPGNVISTNTNSDGTKMSATSKCPEVPFKLTSTSEGNTLSVRWEVGPLPAGIRNLSFPADFSKGIFIDYEFPGEITGYEVGCGNSWHWVSGNKGNYKDIPAICPLEGSGVGVARTQRNSLSSQKISGNGIKITRITSGNNIREFSFLNHPGTYNIEVGVIPQSGAVITINDTFIWE